MGMGHVPQEPVRGQGAGAELQGRQRRRAAVTGALNSAESNQSNRARGRWGEDRAAAWYEQHGYSVVMRNWRCDAGELDIVAYRGSIVVFAEVKARRTERFGPAASAVGWQKQARLRRLAARWLAEHGVHGVSVRFDVVAVTGVRIDVIEAAF